jgi:hypothetical protein
MERMVLPVAEGGIGTLWPARIPPVFPDLVSVDGVVAEAPAGERG